MIGTAQVQMTPTIENDIKVSVTEKTIFFMKQSFRFYNLIFTFYPQKSLQQEVDDQKRGNKVLL